jgi:rhodanese-related sulfurtransferase
MTHDTTVEALDPTRISQIIESEDAILIDCREPMEHARERIAGARLAPIDSLDAKDFAPDCEKIAVFHCRSGVRTAENAAKLAAMGFRKVYVIDGGIESWKKAGLPVERNPRVPIDILRQVQIIAGSLVLLGTILAAFVSPWFILLSGFVGAGMLMAGLTGNCAMANMLTVFPWNRRVPARAGASN